MSSRRNPGDGLWPQSTQNRGTTNQHDIAVRDVDQRLLAHWLLADGGLFSDKRWNKTSTSQFLLLLVHAD